MSIFIISVLIVTNGEIGGMTNKKYFFADFKCELFFFYNLATLYDDC